MHFLHVVGARPNFMKLAPVYRAIARFGQEQSLVHTGQHYDTAMSDIFFNQLEIAPPTCNLEVGPGSHAQQTALIISRFEPVVLQLKPDLVLVYGDVNSTVAAALVCSKLGVRVAHVEAGLRSFDRSMPEEINRLVTDQLSDVLLTPSIDGNENLIREGIAESKIHFVGNVMIDTLLRSLPATEPVFAQLSANLGLQEFGLLTLHRPSNVDEEKTFLPLLEVLKELTAELPFVFPVHPRTRQRWSAHLQDVPGLKVVNPLGYLEFLALERHAKVVVTDSGGVQEETTVLNVPCITLRENTERPVTISHGTNVLVGHRFDLLKAEFARAMQYNASSGKIPPLWDGHASERIATLLCGFASASDSLATEPPKLSSAGTA